MIFIFTFVNVKKNKTRGEIILQSNNVKLVIKVLATEARWHIGTLSALYNWTMAVRGSNPSKGKDFNINTYIKLADLLL